MFRFASRRLPVFGLLACGSGLLLVVLATTLTGASAAAAPNYDIRLPWTAGQTWYLTGGPHPYDGSATPPFQAVDFAPSPAYNVRETSGECVNTYSEMSPPISPSPTTTPTTTPTMTKTPGATPATPGSIPASPTPNAATPSPQPATVTPTVTPTATAQPTTPVIILPSPRPSATAGVTPPPQAGADKPGATPNPATVLYRSTLPLRAPHAGVIAYSVGTPYYALRLDYNDGTGRQILMQHVAPTGRIAAGTVVKAGDIIGYPSNCGYATGVHVHFVTLLNGVPQPIAGVVISGWTIHAGQQAYEGDMERNGVIVGVGGALVSDNVQAIAPTIAQNVDAADSTLAWAADSPNDPLATAPVVADGRVYVGTQGGRLSARDAVTGAELWAYTAPAAVTTDPIVADGRVLVGTGAMLTALDAATGDQLWTYTAPDTLAKPVYRSAVVYAVSGTTLTALDAASGGVLTTAALPFASVGTPALDGAMLILCGGSPVRVAGYDLDKGALAWATTVPEARSDGSACAAAITDGTAVVNLTDGETYADSGAYLPASQHIFALDAQSGAIRWAFTAGRAAADGASTALAPVIAGSVVYAPAAHELYAFDAKSGHMLWRNAVDGAASPIVVGSRIIATDTQGVAHIYSRATGAVLAQTALGDVRNQTFANGTLYIVGITRLAARPGASVLRFDAPAAPIAGGTFFADTGHSIIGAFRDYWQTNGGAPQFGPPITDEITQFDGAQVVTLQYFQHARFTYQSGGGVTVEMLDGPQTLADHAATP